MELSVLNYFVVTAQERNIIWKKGQSFSKPSRKFLEILQEKAKK